MKNKLWKQWMLSGVLVSAMVVSCGVSVSVQAEETTETEEAAETDSSAESEDDLRILFDQAVEDAMIAEDGFVLHSLYMHCKTVNVEFSCFQKFLRRFICTDIPLSNLAIGQHEIIGLIGSSGHKFKYTPHLHLQLEFIAMKKNIRVAVDPIRMYGHESSDNLSASLNNMDDFKLFYKENFHELSEWRKFFETYITE